MRLPQKTKKSQFRVLSGVPETDENICLLVVGPRFLCRSLIGLLTKNKSLTLTVKYIRSTAKKTEAVSRCTTPSRIVLLIVSVGDAWLQTLLSSELIRSFLSEGMPPSWVLFCSGNDAGELRRAWEVGGVRVFLGGDASMKEMNEAILAAANHGRYASKDVAELLSQITSGPPIVDTLAPSDPWLSYLSSVLTEREAATTWLASQGHSNEEIAEKLFVSVATVKSHLNHVFKKLKIKRRSQLIALSVQHDRKTAT